MHRVSALVQSLGQRLAGLPSVADDRTNEQTNERTNVRVNFSLLISFVRASEQRIAALEEDVAAGDVGRVCAQWQRSRKQGHAAGL